MKSANYTGIKDKKPTKVIAYFEDNITSPLFFTFDGITYKRQGDVKETKDKPISGNILFSSFSKDELEEKAKELGKKFYEDIQKSPDDFDEDIINFDEEHWISEYQKILHSTGNISKVS